MSKKTRKYSIRDDGYPGFKKIMRGKAWVGRVMRAPQGFVGMIGTLMAYGPTEEEAFNEVTAKHLGYNCMAEINQVTRGELVKKWEPKSKTVVPFIQEPPQITLQASDIIAGLPMRKREPREGVT